MCHRHVKEHIIVNSETHQGSNEFKIDVWLKSLTIEPVKLHIFVKFKHAVLRVEKFLHYQTEVLLHYAAHINAWFIFKFCFQRQFQWVKTVLRKNFDKFFERVSENVRTIYNDDVVMCGFNILPGIWTPNCS